MRTVGAIIRAQRRHLGLTLQVVADMVGCTKGYLSAIENNRRENPPSSELLSRIERALQLQSGSLVSVGNWHLTPRDVRRRLLKLETQGHLARRLAKVLSRSELEGLSGSGELRRLIEQIEDWAGGAERAEPRGAGPGSTDPRAAARNSSLATRAGGGSSGEGVQPQDDGETPRHGGMSRIVPLQVPLISPAASGYPMGFTDLEYPGRVADEYVCVPDVDDPDAFAVRVVGECMEPLYKAGDIVVFSPSTPAQQGVDCFVRIRSGGAGADEVGAGLECAFRRVYIDGEETSGADLSSDGRGLDSGSVVRLQPLNPAFTPRVVARRSIAGLYPAVCVVRSVGVTDRGVGKPGPSTRIAPSRDA